MHDRNLVGDRGEAIFKVLMTRNHPAHGPLFNIPRFLGEKARTLDFLVELFHVPGLTPFFFVQVRTTRMGYTSTGRLKVALGRRNLERMALYPAPSYVVGIDERGERGYIVSANRERVAGFSSLCTDYPLEPDVLAGLWDEVLAYWTMADRSRFRSNFEDPRWRRT